MRYFYLLLLFILPFTINSQKDVEILNDSFFIVSYSKVNSIKERTENLKKQIEILSQYAIVCDTATKKAISKEIWYNQEVEKWARMDSIMREKLILSNDVIHNYKTIVILTEEQLKKSEKSRKKEEFWKNVYKIPAMAGVVALFTYVILK